MTHPWIAAELARLRSEEVGREAERRRQAKSPAAAAGGHTASRWLGQLLIRAGVRLGGDGGLRRSPLPDVGTLEGCGDGPGFATGRQLPVRFHTN